MRADEVGTAGGADAGVPGVHHVTAIGGDPQAMLDFYTGLLGLRLVKRTVNFDDPATCHLYFGDAAGRPGTLMTLFPWPGAPRGRRGIGQVGATAFAVPQDAIGWWSDRLRAAGVDVEGPAVRLGEELISVADPDGLVIELVGVAGGAAPESWPGAPPAPAVVERQPVPRDTAIAPDGGTIYVATDSTGLAAEEAGTPTAELENPGSILAFR